MTEAPVEALRTLFLDDLLSRPLTPDKQTGGLVDRAGQTWIVFDIDGTREAARQRALPQTDELPPAFRRLDEVCASGRARAAPMGDDAPVVLATPPRSRAMATVRSGQHQSSALAVGIHPGGVDSASWHRLRTGRLRAVRTLDLHGFTPGQEPVEPSAALLRVSSMRT